MMRRGALAQYAPRMSSLLPDWWIAPAGLRAVETDPEATAIPDSVLACPSPATPALPLRRPAAKEAVLG